MQFTAGNEDPEGPPLASSATGAAVSEEDREALLRRPCIAKAARREWELARQDYRSSTSVFQRSRNLPGAIFASSNAALVSAQLGDDAEALKVRPLPCVRRNADPTVNFTALCPTPCKIPGHCMAEC